MTPNDHIKFKTMAQERSVLLLPVTEGAKRFDTEKYVEGYATNYERYLLWECDGRKTYERFERGCFANTDMSDVIMQFDHEGRVFARITNDTLLVEADDKGLFVAADLDKTDLARGLYEDIDAKMITRMSWRFKVGKYHVEYDETTGERTIVHTEIPKIYDVCPVSIPANDTTEINARDFVHGVMDEIARSEAELDDRRRKLRTKINITLGGI